MCLMHAFFPQYIRFSPCFRCGPTVYAPSHMGHARTYLGMDILRRILQDYFRYDVTLIMNITDIDDKIIDRSAEQKIHHLELSSRFEQEYHKDMQDLGVLLPSCLTRVTEYIPEIVDYIQRIVEKGLAYESNGSVYFHVQAFEQTPHMHYCKLAPEQILNAELLAEGEGKLTQEFVSDKKSPRDFALWKKSKEGEPSWESPWGPGRPGWHIECSAMASDVLDRVFGIKRMDIHSGGVDLKFPHHDNEMAQAEAECGETQWVNYFIHTGHLHIKGLKMSKSLKNFITIQQALEINSARQIRMLFLLHKYNTQMDYGDNTMQHALEAEKRFVEFFHNVKACLRQNGMEKSQKWTCDTVALERSLRESMTKVDTAMRDDFDTPTVLSVLTDLVKATNVYMENTAVVGLVVRNVATYITRIFKVFGLILDETIGFGSADGGSGGASREEVLQPVLDALMDFRASVRDKARRKDIGAVLDECDRFRDNVLPPIGIRLEDKADASVWKLADPQELIREMEQRQAEAERKAEEKAKKAEEAAKKEALNRMSPEYYMKQLTLEDETTLMYSKFDETGLPTHDDAGEPLNKNQCKKAQKLFKTQQAKYEKFLKTNEQD
jgi:cysteinyl-tRNA synthetase